MTIGTSTSRVSFACDGATKIFPVPIQGYLNTDFTVILTTPISAGGGEATLVLNSDYSLAPSGTLQPTAWTLTTLPVAAYLTGYTLQVFCNPVQQQQTQYVQGQAFPSLAVQTNVDRLTQMVQRLQDQVNRCIRVPDGDVNPLMLLPVTAARLSQSLMMDASGNITLGVPNTQTITTALLAPFLNLGQTAAEAAVPVTPSNLGYRPLNPYRYGADGTGGAADTTALAAVQSVLTHTTTVDEWRNGLAVPGFLQTPAEIAAVIRPVNWYYPSVEARRFGFSADNNTATAAANTAALNNAIAVAAASVGSAQGATVVLPTGIGYINSTIVLPNRVRIVGQNLSGSILKATAAFSVPSQPYMFWANNGVTAMFDSILQDLFIDCSSVAGLGGVLTDAWQENSGLRSVAILGFRTYGLRYRNVGAGGQATNEIQQVQFFASNSPGVSACIRVDQISSVGATLIHVRDSVLTGNAANPVAIGCDIANDSLLMDNVHFEGCVDAVQSGSGAGGGVGSISLHNVTGLAGMTSILHVLATFTGRINMNGCARNGATNLVKNDASGETYTSPDLADYVYPEVVTQNTLKAWCVFDGTTVGTNAPLKGYNVTSVTRNGAGDYTITYTRALKDAVNCVNGNSVLSGTTPGTLSVVSTGQGSCRVNLTKSAALTDSSQVMVEVKGL